jgi:hypothetical protein
MKHLVALSDAALQGLAESCCRILVPTDRDIDVFGIQSSGVDGEMAMQSVGADVQNADDVGARCAARHGVVGMLLFSPLSGTNFANPVSLNGS